jgi:hypothetical protein
MAGSFQERLDIFCADFAAVGHIAAKREPLSPDQARDLLARHPEEEEDEFGFRCEAIVRAYAFLLEHWSAFQNIGFVRETAPSSWHIEGHLLYALCLYLGGDDSSLENPPDLETIIDSALHGPV